MEGVLLRSKAKWLAEGEKITEYFCNVEKRNNVSKQMTKLLNKGVDINDPLDINMLILFIVICIKRRN